MARTPVYPKQPMPAALILTVRTDTILLMRSARPALWRLFRRVFHAAPVGPCVTHRDRPPGHCRLQSR